MFHPTDLTVTLLHVSKSSGESPMMIQS
jgi:hypothetical protein